MDRMGVGPSDTALHGTVGSSPSVRYPPKCMGPHAHSASLDRRVREGIGVTAHPLTGRRA